MTTPTLYEWAGGHDALRRLTEVFYDKVLEDPILAPVFAHATSAFSVRKSSAISHEPRCDVGDPRGAA